MRLMYLPFLALFALSFGVAALARKLGLPDGTRQQRFLTAGVFALILVVMATRG